MRTPPLVPVLLTAVDSRWRGRAATAAGSVQDIRPRTGISRAASTASTARTGRSSVVFQQGCPRSSTADAATPVRSPAGGQRSAVTGRQADPGGVVDTGGSAADSAAVSGTEARLEGAPARGSEKISPESPRIRFFFYFCPSSCVLIYSRHSTIPIILCEHVFLIFLISRNQL